MDKNGEGHCYTCMGCRSFLTPYVDPETGKPKYYGRFNQGVVTINLVDVALSSGGDFDKFWKIFDERLALCHRALQARHKRLLGKMCIRDRYSGILSLISFANLSAARLFSACLLYTSSKSPQPATPTCSPNWKPLVRFQRAA